MDDAAALDAQLRVAVLERARTVRDHDRRAVARQPIERIHDLALCSGVHRARGLIQDEQRRIPQERPSQRDPLALSAGQQHPALADARLVALGQRQDEVVRVRRPRGGLQLGCAGPGVRVGDVRRHARGEEHGLLEHDRQLPSQISEPIVTQVDAVQKDPTAGRIVEAQQQADQRGLACAGCPGDAKLGPAVEREGDVMEHLLAVGVCERHIVEHHRARCPPDAARVRTLTDLRGLVEEPEHPLGAGQVGLQLSRQLADAAQRRVQLPQVAEQQDQLSQRDHTGLDMADADEQECR